MSGWKWMAEKNLMKIPTGLGKKIDEKRAYGFRILFLITIFIPGSCVGNSFYFSAWAGSNQSLG